MPDVITETSSRSYGSRLGSSLKAAVFGVILFIASFPILWNNEGNYIHTAKGLDEGKNAVVVLNTPEVKPENNGKLVYVTGPAVTNDALKDPDFGITSSALLLNRKAEMYQWKENVKEETREHVGGSEETVKTYTYAKEWSDKTIASSSFKEQVGHENPGTMPYSNHVTVAKDAKVGEFALNEQLIRKLGGATPVAVSEYQPATIANSKTEGQYVYIGNASATPAIGDMRISFSEVNPGIVSIVAQQSGSTFSPYTTKFDTSIALIAAGTKSADSLFADAKEANQVGAWITRGVGFVMMWFGLMLMLGTFSMIFAVLPFLKGLAGFFIGAATFAVALVLSLLTISAAWLFYRPVVSLLLLAAIIAVAVLVKFTVLDRGKKVAAAAAPLVPQPAMATAPAVAPVTPAAAPIQTAPIQPAAPVAVPAVPSAAPAQSDAPQQPPQVPPVA